MKSFVSVLLLVAGVAVAEPPRYRDARVQQQEAAPYPAAGYKPDIEFNLPSRQELQPPATSYGVPTDSYAAPVNSYGVPRAEGRTNDRSEGDNNDRQEGDDAETVEAVDGGDQSDKKGKLQEGSQEEGQVVSSRGAYYVLLPGSQLQRVQFSTENDLRNMAYTARLRYSDADRAPLYLYTPVAPATAPATAPAVAPASAPAAAYIQLF